MRRAGMISPKSVNLIDAINGISNFTDLLIVLFAESC